MLCSKVGEDQKARKQLLFEYSGVFQQASSTTQADSMKDKLRQYGKMKHLTGKGADPSPRGRLGCRFSHIILCSQLLEPNFSSTLSFCKLQEQVQNAFQVLNRGKLVTP